MFSKKSKIHPMPETEINYIPLTASDITEMAASIANWIVDQIAESLETVFNKPN